MYKAGDMVIYGVDGVCRVSGTTVRNVAGRRIEYYVLNGVGQQSSTTYVPMGNETLVARMRKVMSGDETLALIEAMPDTATIWIEDANQRQQAYEQILAGEDRVALIQLVKTLYLKKQELTQNKRKLPAADDKLLHEAERRLHDEFAHALDIEPDQVLPFIMGHLA